MTNPRPANAFIPFDREDLEGSIPSRFEAIAAKSPGRLAVKFGSTSVSYGELDVMANRIAHAVLAARGAAAEPVALLIEQGIPLIAGILGTLKAGKIYVPLDPAHTSVRLATCLRECEPALIVASDRTLDRAREAAPQGVAVMNAAREPASGPVSSPGLAPDPGLPACIYYTSGSTGRAKGVVDTHRNVLHNVMRYTNTLHISSDDRLTLLQGPAFSGAVSSMFGALLNGAAVFPFDVGTAGAKAMADWLRRERLTIYHSVPALFRVMASATVDLPALRLIRLEGDRSSRRDLELFRERFGPDCLLVNGLGASECGLVRQFFIDVTTPVPGPGIPIGYAVEDMEVLVAGPEGLPVPRGEVGEIIVRSRYLARGYWRDPDRTAAAFGEDEVAEGVRRYRTGDLGRFYADGCLEYLGRADDVPKINGIRVDVAEIEAALLGHGLVREAAVVVRCDEPASPKLVGYVVPAAPTPPSAGALRRHLQESLPEEQIPSRFVMLEQLPLSENGKLDRRAFPAPAAARPALDEPFVAAASERQRVLTRLWTEMLGMEGIGIHDSFFDCGGDSLLAMRLLMRVHEHYRCDIPLSRFFPRATIAELDREIERATGEPG